MSFPIKMLTLISKGYFVQRLCFGAKTYSSAAQMNFSGVFAPIITPFKSDESISYDKLEFNLKLWNRSSLSGYLVEGSNGEAVLLTPEERINLVATVRKLISTSVAKLIIGGSGCEGTWDTVRMSKSMAAAGADAVMVVTPSYYKTALKDAALIKHYETVADESPVPVLLYSVPSNTGIDLSVAAVKRLCQHANIVGMKDSGGDVNKLATLVSETRGQHFQVMAGSAGYMLPALRVGCVGAVCALANVLPDQVCELYRCFTDTEDGANDRIEALQKRLVAPNIAVTRQYGVAGLKLVMEWLGYAPGRTRLPLLPLTEKESESLRKVFVDAGFLK